MNSINVLLRKVYQRASKSIFPIGVSWKQGEFLRGLVQRVKPREIIELGLGAGLSALWLEFGPYRPYAHTIVDRDLQNLRGFGKKLLQKSKLTNITLVQQESQLFLASMLTKNVKGIDMFFVDVDEKFDSVVADIFFITKIVSVGGI